MTEERQWCESHGYIQGGEVQRFPVGFTKEAFPNFCHLCAQIFEGEIKDHLHTILNKSSVFSAFRILWRKEGQLFYMPPPGTSISGPSLGPLPLSLSVSCIPRGKEPFLWHAPISVIFCPACMGASHHGLNTLCQVMPSFVSVCYLLSRTLKAINTISPTHVGLIL